MTEITDSMRGAVVYLPQYNASCGRTEGFEAKSLKNVNTVFR